MKKIMFMINSLYGGGAERILQTIISNFDYSKYDVTLYSIHKEVVDRDLFKGNFHYKYLFDENAGIINKIKGLIFLKTSPKFFYKLFVKGKYDVEIAFIEGESTKIISGSSSDSKKIAWVHVDLEKNPWTDFLYKCKDDERDCYLEYNKILGVSKEVTRAFVNKYNFDENRVNVQYNPVNAINIIKKSQEYSVEKRTQGLQFVSVGRLVEQKGFDRLIRVVNKLKVEKYIFNLLILGEGEQREELEQFIIENELQDYIKLMGFIENPYPYIRCSDLMICSSRAEGFSTVATEALILGVPIITTNCAGMKELFGETNCGIITENSEEGLYNEIKNTLDNTDRISEWKECAIDRGKDFDLDSTMNEIYAKIESLF